jgi:lipid-A-disaccharide synthase-like uncharacterized protein
MKTVWLVIGLAGQIAFGARFLVQWIYSERKRRSVIPTVFWWLSLVGGGVLLAYSIYIRNPVFIIGQGSGLIVYVRNLILIYRRRARVRSLRAERAERAAGRD